jgi:tripartite-type tricarboxylate transporter receptor subunit TctC
VLEALKSPRVQMQLRKQGAEPGTLGQPDFVKFVDSEMTRWNKVITTANITLN